MVKKHGFTLNNCLLGYIKLSKNADTDKFKYSWYDIGFDSCSELSVIDSIMDKNVIICEADMSPSVQIDNKNKDILFLSKGPTQVLNDIKLIAEAKYPINFPQQRKRSVLSLHYNGSNIFLFVNATKICYFKARF